MSGLDILPHARKNVGGYDRLARILLGVALVVVGTAAFPSDVTLAALAFVGAAGLFFNAATQFCGINAVLGVDTCSRDADGECQN
ncbi:MULTISPECIES: YgaP family membrane protein [Salinibaculum]|uniref:YgaP family membrane protein n=1 Tax=Salinibaculum TaxID=2732368 RepID=UPI0030D4CED8